MQPEVDPVFTFRYKLRFSLLASFREEFRLRALHSKVNIPVPVMHAPDAAHSSMYGIRSDLIGFQDLITLMDFLVRDSLLSDSICQTACGILHTCPRHGHLFIHASFTDRNADAVGHEFFHKTSTPFSGQDPAKAQAAGCRAMIHVQRVKKILR